MKKYKSITNSMRHVCILEKSILSSNKNGVSNKLLFNRNIKNYAGRNNSGRITVYTKGVKRKRLYRIIDYKRNIYNVPALIYSTEYDPNRSSFISLIIYKNHICCYISSINNLNIGTYITTYKNNNLLYKKGDNNKLLFFNTGAIIHNLEYLPNNGGIYIRSAGTYGKIIKKYLRFNKALVELPSKSIFYASIYSSATLGVVSNPNYNMINIGKAGRNR